MEDGVDNILEHLCQNHLQVLEGLSIVFFELPPVFVGSMLCFCYRGDGYFVTIANFLVSFHFLLKKRAKASLDNMYLAWLSMGNLKFLLYLGCWQSSIVGDVGCWMLGARGYCWRGQSNWRQPWPVAWLWCISPWRRGYSNCVGNVLLASILETPVSILQLSWLDGGGCTAYLSWSRWPETCGDDSGRSLCQLSCSALIMDDLKVLGGLFQN